MKTRKSSKDATFNLFNRYVWLADLIYRRGKITFEEINEYWQRSLLNHEGEDLPLRTFHNHRVAIEQMFDINIDCDKRDGYRYFIENSDDIERGGVRNWLLNTLAVNNLINESHKIKQRILFEQIPSGQKYLVPIIEAMRDGLSIEITYQNFHGDPAATFEIYPYCVKVFRQRWYVVAYCPSRDKMIINSLDRIKELIPLDASYKIPEDFDGEEFFEDCFGIFAVDEAPAERVVLKVRKNQDNYIRALPLHHSQREEENAPDYALFSYFIRPTFDFRQELLSHGDAVEVLEPQWFRDEIAEVVAKQHRVYQGGN